MVGSSTSVRRICVLAGIAGVVGVLMIGQSFAINNGPALGSADAVFVQYATTHRDPVLLGAWLQSVGPALIIVLALTLVWLAEAARRVSGLLTIFGASVLMATSLLEVACYIGGLFTAPSTMPRIANTLGYAVQHLYFSVAAPSLFLPLGFVLLGSSVLPRGFGWTALLLGGTFFVLSIVTLHQLVLPYGVTAFAGVQAIWWLCAGVALIARARGIATRAAIAASPVSTR